MVSGLLVAATLFLAACSRPGGPNLVLVSIDTLRADHLGVYGYPRPTTPAIDRFAKDAVLFERFTAYAPSTLPSHASIFTSLAPDHHGGSSAVGTVVSPGVPTITEVLKDAGYATASFNDGVQLDAVFGLARGFDVYEASRAAGASADVLVGPETTLANAVRRGIDWLKGVRRPFFLFLHTYEIHHPYTPAPPDLAALERAYEGPLPDSVSVELLQRINAGDVAISDADAQHIVNTYDAELRSADRAFQDLLSYLRETGLYDETVIVLVSDHGEEFGEHGSQGWHSHTLYDELLHVPALVKLPSSRHAGRVVAGQVRAIDLAPTLLAVLGLDSPPEFAGVDRAAAIVAGRASDTAVVPRRDKAEDDSLRVRTDRWKLYQGELFDLAHDPREQVNVAERHPDVIRRLAGVQQRFLEERPIPEPISSATPPEVVEKLRALGYVE